jgi:hypothetical protein
MIASVEGSHFMRISPKNLQQGNWTEEQPNGTGILLKFHLWPASRRAEMSMKLGKGVLGRLTQYART